MQRMVSLVLILLAMPILASFAESAELLLQDATLFGQFETLRAQIEMEIHDRGVRSRTLALSVDQGDPDSRKVLAQITAPAFLNRMKYLAINTLGTLERWMSSSSGVRRIGQTSGNERLFDSDFTVEDFSPGILGGYSMALAGTAVIGGEECHTIDIVPNSIAAGYARRRAYVSTNDRMLVRAEYYDGNGLIVRVMEVLERSSVDGRPFPGAIVMRSLNEQTHTILTIRSVELDIDIPARVFSRGAL